MNGPAAGGRRPRRRWLLPVLLLALGARADDRLEADLSRLAPQRPGHPDLFVLAIAGDGSERVFRNEVLHLERLAATRLDAAGRVLVLANHPPSDGVRRYPDASEQGIRAALAGLGARMDPHEDLLLLYVTTHGTEDHELHLLRPGRAPQLMSPQALREALDASGVRHRVLVISACFSGGFIRALRDPDTLVLTAARRDRPSFGCGHDSVATYFGRAWLVDGLNATVDFDAAFDQARVAIEAREMAEGRLPSLPQRHRGERIGATLAAWRAATPVGPPVAYPHAEPEPVPEGEVGAKAGAPAPGADGGNRKSR